MSNYQKHRTPINQVRLTNVAYVRLSKHGKRFELACYSNKILGWRNKVETDISEVLQIPLVFTNVSKGMQASEEELLEVFQTSDHLTVCQEILNKGEIQLGEKERAALIISMNRDIASIVADKSINPENDRPYTISMIQNAMKQIHFSIKTSKSAKSQALEVIKKLKDVMPIARACMLIRVVCNVSLIESILSELVNEKGLEIMRFSKKLNDNNENGSIELKVETELFRRVEEIVQMNTNGDGRVEVINLRVASSGLSTETRANESTNNSSEVINHEDDNEKETSLPNKSIVPNLINIDTNDQEEEDITEEEIHINKEKTVFHKVTNLLLDSSSSSSSSDSDNEEIIVAHQIVDTKQQNKKKQKQQKKSAMITKIIDDEISSDENDDIDISPLNFKSKVVENTQTKAGNKKGKKNKRLEKDERKEKEVLALKLQERINLEQEKKLETEPAVIVNFVESSSTTTKTGPKCNTCETFFSDTGAFRIHFKSEWHRCNVNRKAKLSPIIATEIEFLSLSIEELALFT